MSYKFNLVYTHFYRNTLKELGYRLRELRLRKGYTVEELSKNLNFNPKKYLKMESEQKVSFTYLALLALFYKQNIKIILEDK